MLKTEMNTRLVERRVLKAARKVLGYRRGLFTYFEHGQWWVTHMPSGAQWSVGDAVGAGSVDGFDFEQVTMGEEND